MEQHDVVIVGAGQAGLAMSWHLARRGVVHVLLERGQVGERWRTARWDSLAFQLENRTLELPGKVYDGDDPAGFAGHAEILRFITDYAALIGAPVRPQTAVLELRRTTTGYLLNTTQGPMEARRVVIATGPFHEPKVPSFAAALPTTIFQTDAVRYKSPASLPPGAVLVVGSGSSGTQIAEELLGVGRKVFLSVGRHRYTPRRYRGRDVIWWLDALGRLDMTIDEFPDRACPPPGVLTGAGGGRDLFPRLLATRGAVLLGRITGCADGVLDVAGDMNKILADADKSCLDFLAAADALATAQGLELATGTWAAPASGDLPVLTKLDLAAESIGTVIWATGYRSDYAWVKLPLFDGRGEPVQARGVSSCPGVYFLGLQFMHNFRSGLLSFVQRDAEYIAEHITATMSA